MGLALAASMATPAFAERSLGLTLSAEPSCSIPLDWRKPPGYTSSLFVASVDPTGPFAQANLRCGDLLVIASNRGNDFLSGMPESIPSAIAQGGAVLNFNRIDGRRVDCEVDPNFASNLEAMVSCGIPYLAMPGSDDCSITPDPGGGSVTITCFVPFDMRDWK